MVLAHQGGWDEALMVLAPLALLFFLLWIANRRAKAQFAAREASDVSEASDGSGMSEGSEVPGDEPAREPRE